MKTIFVTLFLVVLQVALIKSQQTFQCNGHEIQMSSKQIEAAKKCGENIGVKSMEEMTPDKIPCFAKCILQLGGLTDDQGKPHKENILRDIDSAIAGDAKEKYKAATEKCIDLHGQNLKPDDKSCASYAPLAMCVAGAFKVICNVN